jgi:hypothetical protein
MGNIIVADLIQNIDRFSTKNDKCLISRLNVVNFMIEVCQNVVICKIPHGDLEKLACMVCTPCYMQDWDMI